MRSKIILGIGIIVFVALAFCTVLAQQNYVRLLPVVQTAAVETGRFDKVYKIEGSIQILQDDAEIPAGLYAVWYVEAMDLFAFVPGDSITIISADGLQRAQSTILARKNVGRGSNVIAAVYNDMLVEAGDAVTITRETVGPLHMTVVPLDALTKDANGNPALFIASATEGIFGTEYQTNRVTVDIVDQDHTRVAVETARMIQGERVILSPEEFHSSGIAVRILE